MRCESCKLVLNSGLDYDYSLLAEDNLDGIALAAPLRKISWETCNKEISWNVYENHLRTQSHNNNHNSVVSQWMRCGNSSIEIRNTFWEKHVRSKS